MDILAYIADQLDIVKRTPCECGHIREWHLQRGGCCYVVEQDTFCKCEEFRPLEQCWNCGAWVSASRDRCPACDVQEPPF
jgi:hypothetical protein